MRHIKREILSKNKILTEISFQNFCTQSLRLKILYVYPLKRRKEQVFIR